MRVQEAVPHVETADVKQAGRRGVTVAARIGYLTHGMVYALVGAFALLSVFGLGWGVTDHEGAVRRVGDTAYGQALLWAIAFGLACYALWNVVRAGFDPEAAMTGGSGVLRRIGYGISATSHGLLATHTLQLAYGASAARSGRTATIAQGLNAPGGTLLVAAIGVGVIGFGALEIYRAITNKLAKEFNGAALPDHRTLILTIARIGHGTRGVVFGIIGSSLIAAAVHARPREAFGFDDALRELAGQPFGSVHLAVVALGLVAYGLDMLCLARYARIPEL
ncbi:MAG: hypothetical protein RL701_5216 [Pseudomonadota bacterium]